MGIYEKGQKTISIYVSLDPTATIYNQNPVLFKNCHRLGDVRLDVLLGQISSSGLVAAPSWKQKMVRRIFFI